ncbi:hypothetical protein EV177_008697, partial [Coemansia sp. RSA 1804]
MSPVSSTKTTLAPLAWATNTGSASLQTLGSIAIVYPFSTSIPLLVTSFPTNLPQIASVSVASVQMNSQSPSLASTSERSLSLWKSNDMVSTTNPSSEFEITASASKWAQWSSSSTASESDASATASSPSTTSTSATSSSTSGSSTSTNSSTSTSTSISISGSAGSLAHTPTSTNSYTVSLVSSSARSGDHLVAFSVHVPSPITVNTDDLVEVLISRPPISTQAAINSAASSVDSVTDIAGGWNNGVGSSGSTGISASASTSTTSGSSSSSSSDTWLDWPAGSYGIGGDSNTSTSADAHSPASNTPTPTAGPMRKRAAAAMALPSPDKVQYASQTRSIPPEALESARSLLSAMRNIATRSEKNIADHHMPNNVVRTMVGQTIFADDDGPDSNEFTGHVVVLQEALSSIISSMIGTLIP